MKEALDEGKCTDLEEVETTESCEDKFNYYYKKGNEEFRYNYDSKEALKYYNEAMKLKVDDWDLYCDRGDAYYNLEEYQKALKDYNEAHKLKDDCDKVYINRGKAYYALKKYEEAKKEYNKAIHINNDNYISYHYRGDVYYALKEYEKAVQDYNRAFYLVEDMSDYYNVYNDRGKAYYSLKKYEEAIKDFDQIISWNPCNDDIYNYRGNSYYALKKYEEAIKDYNEAINLDKHYKYLNNRGVANFTLKNYLEALKDFEEAITLRPNEYELYAWKGYVYFKLEKYKEAINDFDKAIDLKSNNYKLYFNRGDSKYSLKQYKEAIEDFNSSIKLNPKFLQGYEKRGNSKYILNNNEALEDLITAMKLNSCDTEVYTNIGYVLRKKDNGIKIVSDIKKEDLNSSFTSYIFKSIKNPYIAYKMLNLYIEIMRLKSKCIFVEDSEVAHYTKLNTINFLIKKDSEDNKARLRLNNVAYMNDPTEGKVFFNLLENKKAGMKDFISNLYEVSSGDKREIINGDSNTYLTSFSHAIDSLPMWVQYSADGTGSCLLFKSSFFNKEETLEIPVIDLIKDENSINNTDIFEQSETKQDNEQTYCLYNVLYINEETLEIDVEDKKLKDKISDDIDKIQERLLDLEEHVSDKNVKNIIINILDQVRFLFKSIDYKHEKEARLIKFAIDNVKTTEVSDSFRVPHLYIDVERELEISEVILGPKVTQPAEIATYIKYTGKVDKVTKSKINYQ